MVTPITGALSGIGKEFSRRYAAREHELILVIRRQDKLDVLAEKLREEHGAEVTTIFLDLSESDVAQRLWNETGRRDLHVDALANNAGLGTGKDITDDAPKRLEQEVHLNYLAVVGLTAKYLPVTHKYGNGTIINIFPAATFQPMPHMAVYGATETFTLSFTEVS